MEEEEAKIAYKEIISIIRQRKLDWVADQVEETVNAGKTMSKKVDTAEFVEDRLKGTRRGKKSMAEFATTKAFSEIERLNILLDAIERIMVLPYFASDSIGIFKSGNVVFYSEQEDHNFVMRGIPYEMRFRPGFDTLEQDLRSFQELRQEIRVIST